MSATKKVIGHQQIGHPSKHIELGAAIRELHGRLTALEKHTHDYYPTDDEPCRTSFPQQPDQTEGDSRRNHIIKDALFAHDRVCPNCSGSGGMEPEDGQSCGVCYGTGAIQDNVYTDNELKAKVREGKIDVLEKLLHIEGGYGKDSYVSGALDQLRKEADDEA